MRFRQYRGLSGRVSLPDRSSGRWIVVTLGLVVLVVALAAAAGPYRQTREFRAAVKCGQGNDCFDNEAGSIVGRRIYTTTHTDSDGHTSTTTHYEVTWQRADDGSRQAHDVSPSFYDKAKEGGPATLRLWKDEVVGVEVMGGAQWFLPESGETLGHRLYLAFFGLGVLLWGLLFGWWDGFFMLFFRTFCWMFMSVMPVGLVTDALAYGLDIGADFVFSVVFIVFSIGLAGGMLFSSLDG
jgi:hypothetical protein